MLLTISPTHQLATDLGCPGTFRLLVAFAGAPLRKKSSTARASEFELEVALAQKKPGTAVIILGARETELYIRLTFWPGSR